MIETTTVELPTNGASARQHIECGLRLDRDHYGRHVAGRVA